MKTTIEISEDLIQLIQEEADARGMTVERIVEGGLWKLRYQRLALLKKAKLKRRADVPSIKWPKRKGRKLLIDVSNREELHRALDGEKDKRLYGARYEGPDEDA